jgi:putative membrane protein
VLLFEHWSAPVGVLVPVVVTLALHQVGQRRIPAGAAGSRRANDRPAQAWLFRAGMVAVVLALASPIDYWSAIDFWPHMVQHLVLIFLAAPLIVLGAPWLPLTRALPARLRRGLLRLLFLSRGGRRLRRAGRALTHPVVAGAGYVAVFFAWHIPAAFDATLRNETIHDFEHACFLAIGVWLWGQLVGSYPYQPRWDPLKRVGLVVAVMFANWFLAISMAFAGRPWYPAYAHVAGPHLPLLADQQLAAAFMWVVPMIPFGVVVGWLMNGFITRDGDDEPRLQALIAETRRRMYGDVEPTS